MTTFKRRRDVVVKLSRPRVELRLVEWRQDARPDNSPPPREHLPPEIYHRKNNMKYQMANQNDIDILFDSIQAIMNLKLKLMWYSTPLFYFSKPTQHSGG